MRPPGFANSAEVDVPVFHERGIGEVGALPAPLVKLTGTIVRRNELPATHRGQAARLAEWQRAQQQGVDHAENAGVGANADGQGGNRESRVPRAAGPQPERVAEVLRRFARNLRRNR